MDDIQHQQMGYDRAATMFAPDGHILQVEYAEKTIRLGSPSIGIVCKDGVVVVSDRRKKDELVVEQSANKIHEIDDHIIAASAGISSDARVLVEKARVLSQQHRLTYDSAPTTESIVRDIADLKQQFTHLGGGRPFGVSMMFAGMNGEGVLYTTDVTGNYLRYYANAIGQDDEAYKKHLRERYKKSFTCEEGLKLALEIFEKVQGEKFDVSRFDAGILKDGSIEKRSGDKIISLKK